MLSEAIQSVRDQELLPHAHLIHIDYEGVGTVASLNRLLAGVETTYLNVLSDDNVFYPNHLRLLRESIGDAVLAYSWCDCDGEIPHVQDGSVITAGALVKTEAIRSVGGWKKDKDWGDSREDMRAWNQILAVRGGDSNGKFVCVPEITRKYRFHGDNQSRGGIKGIL